MAETDQEVLAKISQLAGKINRHKNQQAGIHAAPNHHPSHHRQNNHRNGHGTTPSYRIARPHRHRTLVLNGGTQTPTSGASDGAVASDSSASWVSKTDRHLQLINSAVYEKETQTRAKAMEETRKQKLRQQDARETWKLMTHINRQHGAIGAVAANPATIDNHEMVIEGIRFRVVKNGKKLVKVPGAFGLKYRHLYLDGAHRRLGDLNAPTDTPKVAIVGGVKFHRSKNGNLYREGIVKAQRRSGIVKKVNEPCKNFSSTGSCLKGSRCRYNHDASKVAACKDFLQKGTCGNGESCDLSHELTPERTPTCLHFLKGNCSNSNCRYTHSTVSPGALVCRPFGIYGYCEKGASCPERHVSECPDFANTGKCRTKGCKLIHRERASVLRNQQRDANDADEIGDMSSDDESVDSDDVDSDEVGEFIGDGDLDDTDFKDQTDYIAF